ncbi:MAG: (d)CMP kinase [Planctomycetota bacterium]|jgi:cytidylate kinase|nr:(d)CMP kinase [Planctomycetota bacterium]
MSDSQAAVAIDGPAGAGKSSVAKGVAAALGFIFVDTGAMYRAVAYQALRAGVDFQDASALADVANNANLAFDATGTRILLDGEDVSDAIRTPEVAERVKFVARVKDVRRVLSQQQRSYADSHPVVMEGRDITTVVLPQASWKFFLTASPEVRAKRRYRELELAGHQVDLEQILADILARDESDYQVGPLRDARDLALAGQGINYVDSSFMTPEAVIEQMVQRVGEEPGRPDSNWYEDGLAFSCQRCGECCRGPGGYVWLSLMEIKALAAALAMEDAVFARQYLRTTPEGLALVDAAGGDCPLLDPTGHCRVYQVRPRQCSTWPWWQENLASPGHWDRAGRNCPGINQGKRHTRADIDRDAAKDF